MDEQPSGQQVEEVFDLMPKQELIKIKDESGQIRVYTLRDVTGDERNSYIDKQASRMKIDREGNPTGLKSMAGIMEELLVMSLHDDAGNRVDMAFIKSLPSYVQNKLFEKAQKLCGLDTGAKERAKNS